MSHKRAAEGPAPEGPPEKRSKEEENKKERFDVAGARTTLSEIDGTQPEVQEILADRFALGLDAYEGGDALVDAVHSMTFPNLKVESVVEKACDLWFVVFECEGDVPDDPRRPEDTRALLSRLEVSLKPKRDLSMYAWMASRMFAHLQPDHRCVFVMLLNFFFEHRQALTKETLTEEEGWVLVIMQHIWTTAVKDGASAEGYLEELIDEAHREIEYDYILPVVQFLRDEEDVDEDVLRQLEVKDCQPFLAFFRRLLEPEEPQQL